jgi:hypothetical protein
MPGPRKQADMQPCCWHAKRNVNCQCCSYENETATCTDFSFNSLARCLRWHPHARRSRPRLLSAHRRKESLAHMVR